MFTIQITLKSFEYYYIEKNTLFLKKILYLLNKFVYKSKILQENKNVKKTLQKNNFKNYTSENLYLKKKNYDSNKNSEMLLKKRISEFEFQNYKNINKKKYINKKNVTKYNIKVLNYKKVLMINLPKKQKLFTVNSSPHIDKKSRTQFFFTVYTKKLYINIKYIKNFIVFLFLLKNSNFFGTEIYIRVNVTSPCVN